MSRRTEHALAMLRQHYVIDRRFRPEERRSIVDYPRGSSWTFEKKLPRPAVTPVCLNHGPSQL